MGPEVERDPSGPTVPASWSLPEITFKAVVLSVILSASLAGANAYLGLFAGMTVSASIPAAVVSLAVLRFFRQSNILENNIVQTAASAGEALAAGVIFTIPALVLINYWGAFDYGQTTAIAAVGGILGVVFTIPLRRALIEGARLRFPEGVATAEVLMVGSRTTQYDDRSASDPAVGFRTLLGAAGLAGLAKIGESGLRLWVEAIEGAAFLGKSVVYVGLNLSPALLAVGFIIGLNTALVVFLGGALGWIILMPILGMLDDAPRGSAAIEVAMTIWSERIRYVGIGGMLVGGVWTVTQMYGPVVESLRRMIESYRTRLRPDAADAATATPRTDRDAGLPWILTLFGGGALAMFVLYLSAVGAALPAAMMTVVMLMAAFLFSAVAAYMSGIVGSSSNPVSGVTIATLMFAALCLVFIMGHGHPAGPAAALLIAAVVCCAAAMGGDNLQDLKTGHLVGATPWKQQVMQVIGVVTAALILAPVLSLLQAKYGIGEATADHPQPLSAPQAMLMASIAKGVFGRSLPWHLVGLGAGVALVTIWADRVQASRGSGLRFPVLAVALGFYLPLKLSAAILVGGVLAALARQHVRGTGGMDLGLLCAAGLITGEALMGIVLAVPVALTGVWPALGKDPLQLFAIPPLGPWPGLLVLGLIAVILFRAGARSRT